MFANNRVSNMLVKGKNLEEIQAKCVLPAQFLPIFLMVLVCSPEEQYDEAPGAALVGHM